MSAESVFDRYWSSLTELDAVEAAFMQRMRALDANRASSEADVDDSLKQAKSYSASLRSNADRAISRSREVLERIDKAQELPARIKGDDSQRRMDLESLMRKLEAAVSAVEFHRSGSRDRRRSEAEERQRQAEEGRRRAEEARRNAEAEERRKAEAEARRREKRSRLLLAASVVAGVAGLFVAVITSSWLVGVIGLGAGAATFYMRQRYVSESKRVLGGS